MKTVNVYLWPNGSVKISHDGPANRDVVPQQVIPEELMIAECISIKVPEYGQRRVAVQKAVNQ